MTEKEKKFKIIGIIYLILNILLLISAILPFGTIIDIQHPWVIQGYYYLLFGGFEGLFFTFTSSIFLIFFKTRLANIFGGIGFIFMIIYLVLLFLLISPITPATPDGFGYYISLVSTIGIVFINIRILLFRQI